MRKVKKEELSEEINTEATISVENKITQDLQFERVGPEDFFADARKYMSGNYNNMFAKFAYSQLILPEIDKTVSPWKITFRSNFYSNYGSKVYIPTGIKAVLPEGKRLIIRPAEGYMGEVQNITTDKHIIIKLTSKKNIIYKDIIAVAHLGDI